ncbi:hypothetical protein FWH09_03345 [Candidatus Saccharibacteria bacterium]|nr:hypothetical protein [Candidatus Saccharibacteria bacterium]
MKGIKRIRIVTRIITGLLVVVTIIGIILVVINENIDPLDSTFQIIAFSLGTIGLVMAVFGQIDTYTTEKQLRETLSDMRDLEKIATKSAQADTKERDTINKLIEGQQIIYKQLASLDSKNHKPKK